MGGLVVGNMGCCSAANAAVPIHSAARRAWATILILLRFFCNKSFAGDWPRRGP